MTDLASLVLAVDSTQVPKGTAALNELTAAGARAEAAAGGLVGGFKGAGAQAAAMASAAQLSARAAMDQAAGFRVATQAAHVNTMAMRESLVVAREISRGNFTRLPGSLTLLAQGIGSQGGIKAFASALQQQLGLVKTLQNAELAEQAAAAASSAAAVENVARRAAANVFAADTEIALAEAQLRVTAGTSAEAAAQARLAAAHQAVAGAAAEAAIAEDALAVAMGRSAEAGAASAAETTVTVSALGAALGLTAIAGGLLFAAFDEVKGAADDLDPSAQRFIATLGLTRQEIKRLKDETVTWGDVAHGTFNAVAAAAGTSGAQIKGYLSQAFLQTAQVAISAAQVIAGAFAAASNVVRGVANTILAISNPALGGLLGKGLGAIDPLAAFKKAFGDTGKFFQQTLPGSINTARDARLRNQANALIDDRNPKKGRRERNGPKEPEDRSADLFARLDSEILSAKQRLAGTAEEQASLALQQIEVERNKTVVDAQQLLKQHKLTAGEEQHVELQAQQLADLKRQAVLRDEQTKLLTQQQAANDQLFGFQSDALKFADQMAETAAEHRKAQLAMLDIAFQQKAVDLQILETKQRLAGDLAAAELTQNQINQLPVQKAQQQSLVERNTMNPLEAWAKQVPHDAATITEALQSIETRGFDSLASSIADVVTGTKSLGAAFKDISRSIISDIIQMTVKMLIFRAISGIFGGGASFDQGSLNPFTQLAGARASGGPVGAGQTYLVGEKGPELFRPSSPGTIIPNGQQANDNRGGPIEIRLLVDTSENLDAKVDAKVISGSQQAYALSVQHTNNTIRSIARPKLSGR